MSKQTVEEFMSRFDGYRRVPDTGNVIIHPGLTYSFIELKSEFVESLKDELAIKLSMVEAGVDDLNPISQFAIMILENSY